MSFHVVVIFLRTNCDYCRSCFLSRRQVVTSDTKKSSCDFAPLRDQIDKMAVKVAKKECIM